MNLSKAIKEEIKSSGLKKQHIADKLNITRMQLHNRIVKANLTVNQLKQLCDVLSIKLSDLIISAESNS